MKFIIDIEDFYLDPEDDGMSIEKALKSYIVNSVVHQIYTQIKPQIDIITSEEIKKEVDTHVAEKVVAMVDDYAKSGKVRDRYSNGKETPILDYIDQTMQSHLSKNNFDRYIKECAEKIVNEMKNRYDLLFASQIVSNLNKAGYLREDIAKILLEGSEAK